VCFKCTHHPAQDQRYVTCRERYCRYLKITKK